MNKTFDYFGQVEFPNITLCNPNKEELYSLGLCYNTKLEYRYNAISDFSFEFPKSVDGGETFLEAYDHIRNKKLVLVDGYGYFVIEDSQEVLDGSQPIRKVSCKSLEYELVSKKISIYGGTVKLYDLISPDGTLLDDILKNAPNWSVGSVDTSLLTKYRTFDINGSTIYGFLSSDVSSAFECIFVYDTVNRTVSAVSYSNATSSSDIFLSFDNLVSEANINEKTDEITTCISVYGGGELNIRGVNPLGTDKIYDFSYYSNTDWMSQGLVTAIGLWEDVVSTNEISYSSNLLLLKTYNSEMILLESTLSQLNSEYLAIEGVQKVRIQQGIPYSDINLQLVAKQAEIDSQETLIANKQLQINSVNLILQGITQTVSFENNFTPSQLLELNNFIFENTYQNENIIQTDTMTLVEVQDAQEDLYQQSKVVLSRISQPRYEIDFQAVNYLEVQEFDEFTEQTELGVVVNVELEGSQIETVLLEISMSFDNPTDFSMTFSNRLRLDGGDFVYSDLYGQTVKTGSKVSFDNMKWSNWENEYKNDVTSFITSSLNTANNTIINNSNQEILINRNGLRGRTLNSETGNYESTQVWLTSSVLAFSDDSFQTSKLALGSVDTPAGTKFGLVAEVLIGNIIAGNTLTISNDSNNFILDESGATLNNAKFSVSTTNTKIVIDPTATNSFIIQKNEGGTFVNKFWVDNTGNVNFSGNLSGASGSFTGSISANSGSLGGWTINSTGISDSYGNYINSNGNIKLGGLTISGSTATFTGNIYADKLVGAVSYSQLTDIPATKITSGTMSGSRVYGGTIGFPGGASIYSTGSTFEIISDGTTSISSSAGASISAGGTINLSGGSRTDVYNNLNIRANLYANNSLGLSVGYSVQTPYGTRVLTFSKGILVGYT